MFACNLPMDGGLGRYTVYLSLRLLPGTSLCRLAAPIVAGRALLAAIIGAGAATCAEAVSLRGTDNLSVPLVAAAVTLLILLL
jgi:dolichol kinase